MPTCTHCETNWTWKDVFIQMFTVSDHFVCPYCKEKQYVEKRFKRFSNLIFLMMIFLILSGNFLWGPSIFALFLLFLSSGGYFGLYPYFVSFKKRDL